jgi:IclR family pca regulon transcriptional regulator
MTVAISVGTRFPAYATSMGRVLLAGLSDEDLSDYLSSVRIERLTSRTLSTVEALRSELARVRSQGWALVNQELEEGLRALAAPIRDRSGTVVAAVNVSAHASRRSLEAMKRELLPPLLTAAKRIEADLQATPTRRRS